MVNPTVHDRPRPDERDLTAQYVMSLRRCDDNLAIVAHVAEDVYDRWWNQRYDS